MHATGRENPTLVLTSHFAGKILNYSRIKSIIIRSPSLKWRGPLSPPLSDAPPRKLQNEARQF
jgi:hypothetical protein